MRSRYSWDESKAAGNFRKHGVSFDEAETVFDDPFAKRMPDHRHSFGEARYLLVGYSDSNRLLVVAHVESGDDTVYIISARLATRRERLRHEEGE
jgi:uncharacterized protein